MLKISNTTAFFVGLATCPSLNFLLQSKFLFAQSLPELMQGAGIALLTLLIPFAIAIITELYRDASKNGDELDLHVVVDHVWRFKRTLLLLILVTVLPFFISESNLYINFFIFILWTFSFIRLILVVMKFYEWVKGNRDRARIDYLSNKDKSRDDKSNSWRSFWSTSEKTFDEGFSERDYFESFSREIDTLISSSKVEDWELLSKLIEGYSNKIENRNITFLIVFPDFFPKILEWHFLIWKKQYSKFEKGKSGSVPDKYVFEIDYAIDSIIKFITKKSLVDSNRSSFSYFSDLDEHVSKYQDEKIIGDKHQYIYLEKLPIYEDHLELIPKSSESYDIWNHYFPDTWKITKSNYEQNTITKIWYHRFLHWSQSRFWKEKKDWDQEMEELARELFPEVDPITWSKILTFALRPWSKSRIKEVVEKGTRFGFAGRVVTEWGDGTESRLNDVYEEETKNTFDLAIYLFGKIFTKDNIVQWVEEVKLLDCENNSDEYRRKQVWLGIFKELKKRLD